MKNFKKFALAIATASFFATTASWAADTVTLKFANVTNQATKDAAQVFVDTAAKESNGRLVIKHYPDNMLGDDRVATESTILGDIDICTTMPSTLATMIPDFYLWDAPFMFDNIDEAWKFCDSEVYKQITDQCQSKGLLFLGSVENGFRHYTNNKVPVKVPADVKGQKLRVLESEVQIAMWKAWGANPTPMAFAEVLPALQQGTIDAQENPLSIIDSNRLYEVQKYVSLTGHVFSPHIVVMNQEKFESLDPELQTALLKAFKAFETYQRKHATELNDLSVEKFEKAGTTVVEPSAEDKAQWRQIAIDAKVYDLVREKMQNPEVLDKALNKQY